jgi:pimeloyl-ACP methyl ester carboxylesterase
MPELTRPDGARIAWRERGEGSAVVLALQFFGHESVFTGLIDELARDRRVVTYDIRGVGSSSTHGPFDMETDAGDLSALLDEVGEPVVLVSFAEGVHRAIRTAVARSDQVLAVISPAGNPVAREAARGSDALVASDSVIEALVGMAKADYRGALRAMLTNANPDWSDDRVRQRVQLVVDNCPHRVALERLSHWVEDDIADLSRALGQRLWILESGSNPWFPFSLLEKTRELLPEAHLEAVEDGAIARPDITANYVRRVFAAPTQVRGDRPQATRH